MEIHSSYAGDGSAGEELLMKCAVHSEVDAAGFCRNCGKAMCGECTRDVQGVLYCEPCLAALVTHPPIAVPTSNAGNPAVAAMVGIVPTLGAIYNGEYIKAFVHFAIFAGLIAILESGAGGWEPLFGMALAAFIIYMPIEAYRSAKAKMLGLPGTGPLDNMGEGQKPVGAYILIGVGALLLLQQLDLLRIGQVMRFAFPLLLILAGVYLLRKRLQPQSGEERRNG